MRIFVAYGGDTAHGYAKRLDSFLEDKGIESFLGPEKTPIGKWAEPVRQALKQADVFLAVYCQSSANSREFFREMVLPPRGERSRHQYRRFYQRKTIGSAS